MRRHRRRRWLLVVLVPVLVVQVVMGLCDQVAAEDDMDEALVQDMVAVEESLGERCGDDVLISNDAGGGDIVNGMFVG